MKKSGDNYLIGKLEGGSDLNIILLSHNAYWPQLLKLGNHFENCNVSVFGGATSYIRLAVDQRLSQIENCDLIVYYSSGFYNEGELAKLKDMASKVSNEKNKRVSIGYLYGIPVEERPHENISEQVKIVTFKNGEESTEESYPTPYFTVYDLAELTLVTADNYDIGKQQKLEKKM